MSITVDIAIAKGFIQDTDTQMVVYKNGIDALNAFLDGTVDIGTTSPNTIIFSDQFDPKKHAIVGTISYTDNQLKLLTRNASGITQFSDIKGKKVAVIGAFDHFALYKQLSFNGIPQDAVTVVTMSKKQMPIAIAAGQVDAVFQHGKPIESSKKALGKGKWKVFQSQNMARKLLVLMMNRKMIKQHPNMVNKVFKGILKAQEFLKTHPEECIEIVSKSKNYPLPKAQEAIEEITYDLKLRQSLLLAMETMETWAIDKHFVERETSRNYFDYVDPKPLKKAAPDAVTFIH
ncbi:transporter substrate-binding domain-containing protein [Pseudodesulfovibrio sp. JC047]|uniref:ABC transporter substrate-binding protein n=1 Tax=Pseudodesulfovibrio sp. JC047 TaxID=2683199 RepID=UPI0013D27037|nr:ABC transporter substrate-binding protein [Pseudodesulfovibrio sp. JC047]NDV19340.1 transporter substrate-binding domain-containing protein [Pseudodesulfovibrio sp. JC047]